MILLVTNKRDITCDFIVLELQRRALNYLRLNTEDIPHAGFSFTPDGEWLLDFNGATLDCNRVAAAYFRRPDVPIPLGSVEPAHRQYVATEWQAVLQSLYWKLEDRWLNSPHNISLAESKIRQLEIAQRLGFRIPETLISNDPVAAKRFVTDGHFIGKPLKRSVVTDNGTERVIFTTRLGTIGAEDAESIRTCPLIFQKEIHKAFDIRVTVVGGQVFAASIDSQSTQDTEVDWRRTSNPNLAHEAYQLPAEECERCKELTRALGLRYGAIDFVLDPEGNHWFLEINPNGQWGWIEVRTRHPIAAAIVNELEKISQRSVE